VAALGISLWALVDDGGARRSVVGVTAREVLTEPTRFADHSVTLSAQVTRLIGRRGLVLGDAGLLVLRPHPPAAGPGSAVGDIVQVTGTVRAAAGAVLDKELRIDSAAYRGFEQQPVLLADRIALVRQHRPPVDVVPVGVDAEAVIDEPAAYAGRVVKIAGTVSGILGSKSFSVSDGELVVVTKRPASVARGDRVEVTGVVRTLDGTILKTELAAGVDAAALASHTGDPALVSSIVAIGIRP
jgi:hypothetical protein